MKKAEMPHPGHDKHLCYLKNMGFMETNPEDYKMLVRGGKFYCQNCGRVAADAKNLCKPQTL